MPGQELRLVTRAWGRVGRIARRTQDRVRGIPLRTAEKQRGKPVPPGRLIHLVANTEDVAWFLHTGSLAAASIRQILTRNGQEIENFGSILDFGCGVGRVIRHWADLPHVALRGTDYNPALVTWCQRKLPFARFGVNGLDRPLDVSAGTFDFAYCLSVFTHLSAPLQQFWMADLARVLKPGGYLVITTHGDHYLPMLAADEQRQYRSGQLVVQQARREGSNDCAAFHPVSYVRATLAQGFEIIDMIPEGALGNPSQDLWLLRKPV